jgi:hypothetical protein
MEEVSEGERPEWLLRFSVGRSFVLVRIQEDVVTQLTACVDNSDWEPMFEP